jgi:hypothetical protein
MASTNDYIDQEVRIRLLEEIVKDNKSERKAILDKIDSNFHWVLGTILAQIALMISLFGGIVLHMAKLI